LVSHSAMSRSYSARSTLELTGRYTRPRAVDIEATASMLPSLKPTGDRPEALAMTGTDGPDSSKARSALTARTVRDEAFSVVSRRDEAAGSVSEASPQVVASDGTRRDVSSSVEARPVGFEPTTFGFEGDPRPRGEAT